MMLRINWYGELIMGILKLFHTIKLGRISELLMKKLVTQDMLALWYPGKVWKCPLCMLTEDSHNHLFSECEFSNEVWNKVQTMINARGLKNLDSSMLKFSNMPCTNSIWSIVRRLTIASTVYHIWQERNSRVFQQKNRSPGVLYQIIMDNVNCRLLSLKVKNSKAVKSVEELWKIKMNNIYFAELGSMLIITMDGLVSWTFYGFLFLIDSYDPSVGLGSYEVMVLVKKVNMDLVVPVLSALTV
ncbi:RNA-directed DNA polymerase, eukaryota, reverse transcriptase zinc-binding domain protein [Tanacetum coccineum]